MSILQPQPTDTTLAENHALMHRVFAIDSSAPVESVVVDASGNVGIATITPQAPLHIYNLDDYSAFNNAQFYIGGYNNSPGTLLGIGTNQTDNYSALQSTLIGSGVAPLVLNPEGGSVGVGTTVPGEAFSVVGDIYLQGSTYLSVWHEEIITADARSGMTMSSQLSMNWVINANENSGSFRWYNGNDSFVNPLGVDLTTLTPIMELVEDGYLIIGNTTSPYSMLRVNGSRTSYLGYCMGVQIDSTLNAGANSDVLAALYISPTFETGAFSGVTTFGIFEDSGSPSFFDNRIGIGTTAALFPLHVSGSSGDVEIGITNAGTGGDNWILSSANNSSSIASAGGSLVVRNTTASTQLEITSGGDMFTNGGYWSDYGGTSTIVGWTASPTATIYTKKIGKSVLVIFKITGTSNSTSTSFTVPYSAATTSAFTNFSEDNGTASVSVGQIAASSSTVTMYKDPASDNWTGSGTKAVQGQFWYQSA